MKTHIFGLEEDQDQDGDLETTSLDITVIVITWRNKLQVSKPNVTELIAWLRYVTCRCTGHGSCAWRTKCLSEWTTCTRPAVTGQSFTEISRSKTYSSDTDTVPRSLSPANTCTDAVSVSPGEGGLRRLSPLFHYQSPPPVVVFLIQVSQLYSRRWWRTWLGL